MNDLLTLPGGVECIVFTFEPVAWFFNSGHSIRLSLAGADESNFQWEKTQAKENADFLTLSLLSKIGNTDRFHELQQQPLHVGRPQVLLFCCSDFGEIQFLFRQVWEIFPDGLLKLPILK